MTYAPTQVSTVSRAFRTTAAQKLARALAFVREKGEGVLGSIVISESDEEELSGYGLDIDSMAVIRGVSKEVSAAFHFAWIVAPGEAMITVGQWEEVARNRWLVLVDDYCINEARIAASFEHAYRHMVAHVGRGDVLAFSKGLVDMYDDFYRRHSIQDEHGICLPVCRQWSDSRLKVSFIFGPLSYWLDLGYTKVEINRTLNDFCDEEYGCNEYLNKTEAESFRKAYDEMLSTVVAEFEDVPDKLYGNNEPIWVPLFGLEYGRCVAMGEV